MYHSTDHKHSSIHLERTQLQLHEHDFHQYWDENLIDWPMRKESRMDFIRSSLNEAWLYIAYADDAIAGILLNEEGGRTAILLLHVKTCHRNRGIGSALLCSAAPHVKGDWVLGLGRGYWWQGVPEGYGDAFFIKHGFARTWTSIDMLLALAEWNASNQEFVHPVRPACAADSEAGTAGRSECFR
jgi:GNAT superfamily N-acetyltransferase